MWVKGLAALVLGFAAASLGFVGLGDATSRSTISLNYPIVEQALDWAQGRISALRQIVSEQALEIVDTPSVQLQEIVRDGLAEAPQAVAPSSTPSPSCSTADRLAPGSVLIGDRLTLRFFERETVLEAEIAGTSPIYFERLDLSGPYDVDVRGEISVPLLGRIEADGRSLACVEEMFAVRYAETFFAQPTVSAVFLSRAQAVVAGDVRSPGSYSVAPGTTVRHMLALAGARSARGGPDFDTATLAPLLSRKSELDRLLEGVRLRLKVLEAARSQVDELTLSAEDRTDFIAILGPHRLRSESENLRARIAAFRRSQRDHADRIREKVEALAFLKLEREVLVQQIAERKERLDDLRDLATRGLTPLARLSADEAALFSVERAAFDLDLDLINEQAALQTAEREAATLSEEFVDKVLTEIRDRVEESDALEAQTAAIDMHLSLLREGSGAQDQGERYTITRTSRGGTTRFPAKLSSSVLPGDLIEVETIGHRLSELN